MTSRKQRLGQTNVTEEMEFGPENNHGSGSVFDFNVQDLTDRVGYLERGEIIQEFGCQIETLISHTSGEADIYLATKNESPVVLKLYREGIWIKPDLFKKLLNIKHPCLINTIATGLHRRRQYEVLEYVEGGALTRKSTVGSHIYLPVPMAAFHPMIKNITLGLEHLHAQGIVHRDIKPANILVRNISTGDVVLTDFGISTILEDAVSERMTSANRTEGYAAPEIYSGIARRESDFYALGITCYVILTGKDPFHKMNPRHIMCTTVQGRMCEELLNSPQSDPLDERHRQLLMGLLNPRNDKRWDCQSIFKWLNGESIEIEAYTTFGMPSIVIDGRELSDISELAELCFKNAGDTGWQNLLFSGQISQWIKQFDTALAAETESILKRYVDAEGKNLALKVLAFTLNPLLPVLGPKGEEIVEIYDFVDSVLADAEAWEPALANARSDFYLWLETKPKGLMLAQWCREWIDKNRGVGAEFFDGIIQILGGLDRFYIAPKLFVKNLNEIDLIESARMETAHQILENMLNDPRSRLHMWCEMGNPPPRDKELIYFWKKFYKGKTLSDFLTLTQRFWLGRIGNKSYAGEVKDKENQIPEGFGVCHYEEGGKYIGHWHMGKREGHGVLEFEKTKSYTGSFHEDEFHGKGKLQLNRQGHYYEGEFKKGKYCGSGILCDPKLGVFKGLFKEGKKNGAGVFKGVNGHYQEGVWAGDVLQGMVREKLASGECFEGMFEGNERHGKGKAWNPETKAWFEGHWQFGLLDGPGFSKTPGKGWKHGTWVKGNFYNGLETSLIEKTEGPEGAWICKRIWQNGKVADEKHFSGVPKSKVFIPPLVFSSLAIIILTIEYLVIIFQKWPSLPMPFSIQIILFISILALRLFIYCIKKLIGISCGKTCDFKGKPISFWNEKQFYKALEKF
jgi:serine/threonine protein kinase